MTARVVVADDDLLVRAGVVAVLESLEAVTVIGEAASLPELQELVEATEPDVVVTDIRMPPTMTDEGVQAARWVRSRPGPNGEPAGVVVLSQHAEPEHVLTVFEAGNEGIAYLLKENVADRAVLSRAVEAVASQGSSVDPAVVSVLVSSRSKRQVGIEGLTPREHDVLSLIAEGWNNSAIGERLVLSDRAVAKHINSIFAKLQLAEEPEAHRRVKAVLTWLAAAG